MTHHVFTATATVANRFVLKERTVAARPYENPSYKFPFPSACGSGCHRRLLYNKGGKILGDHLSAGVVDEGAVGEVAGEGAGVEAEADTGPAMTRGRERGRIRIKQGRRTITANADMTERWREEVQLRGRLHSLFKG